MISRQVSGGDCGSVIGLADEKNSDMASRRSPAARRNHFRLSAARLTLAGVVSLGLSACGGQGPLPTSDEEKIVQAALGMLSGNGEPLCVDARTVGRPLTVFRSMTLNPPPGTKLANWYVPDILKPPPPMSADEIARGAQADGTAHIDQPSNTSAPLALRTQNGLNSTAMQFSLQPASDAITIYPSWKTGIKARWWLRNRVSRHCSPNYQISNPIVARDTGFVSVKGEHWGTTYAFTRSGGNWAVTAQWSNWLY